MKATVKKGVRRVFVAWTLPGHVAHARPHCTAGTSSALRSAAFSPMQPRASVRPPRSTPHSLTRSLVVSDAAVQHLPTQLHPGRQFVLGPTADAFYNLFLNADLFKQWTDYKIWSKFENLCPPKLTAVKQACSDWQKICGALPTAPFDPKDPGSLEGAARAILDTVVRTNTGQKQQCKCTWQPCMLRRQWLWDWLIASTMTCCCRKS